MSTKTGPDGHPIPEVQGVVVGYIQPIVFKDQKPKGEAVAGARGAALDEHGNVIDQTAEIEAAKKP